MFLFWKHCFHVIPISILEFLGIQEDKNEITKKWKWLDQKLGPCLRRDLTRSEPEFSIFFLPFCLPLLPFYPHVSAAPPASVQNLPLHFQHLCLFATADFPTMAHLLYCFHIHFSYALLFFITYNSVNVDYVTYFSYFLSNKIFFAAK